MYTHMFNDDENITCVINLYVRIKSISLEEHHAHKRRWFRGQSDAEWGLWPGVYRPGFTAADEDDRLMKERHLTQDFRALSAGLLTSSKNEADLYFLQQHYRMPTRLLDWTTSPLAALYFAVGSESDTDGAPGPASTNMLIP
jgi:hypothetical protein